jgi:hypothetical protein
MLQRIYNLAHYKACLVEVIDVLIADAGVVFDREENCRLQGS